MQCVYICYVFTEPFYINLFLPSWLRCYLFMHPQHTMSWGYTAYGQQYSFTKATKKRPFLTISVLDLCIQVHGFNDKCSLWPAA